MPTTQFGSMAAGAEEHKVAAFLLPSVQLSQAAIGLESPARAGSAGRAGMRPARSRGPIRRRDRWSSAMPGLYGEAGRRAPRP